MPRQSDHPDHRRGDDGSVLVIVLVMMVIGALVVVPLLSYTSTVFKAGKVQTDKARSVELARGGTWVALNNEADLFNMCSGGLGTIKSLPSSLDGVSTTCQVLDNITLRPPEEVPYAVGVVQSDESLPSELVSADSYPNPNSTSSDPDGWDDWLDDPDWTVETEVDKLWLPQLPVQATSSGGTRDTMMLPDTQDPAYASCRVFFPGTFTTPLTIAEPAYFTSGVYYFTEPVTIASGADVVVGNGASGGCTTDFEAVVNAQSVPDPLNMSGVGGTFVFGGDGRLAIDDSAGDDIRFVMNQRYVSDDETSVAASSNVSIISVNGTHEPLLPAESLGDDLLIDGVLAVPASTVGTDGDPLAVDSSYEPSVLTPKPMEPDAPTNVQITAHQEHYYSGTDWVSDGMVTVTWDVPNDNGALITEYVATDSRQGLSCSPAAPTLPDTAVQPSCTIYGISHMGSSTRTDVTVQARNAVGWSAASDPSPQVRVDLRGNATHKQTPEVDDPTEPQNVAVGAVYSDGVEITWDPPVDDGGTPVVAYEVTAHDVDEGDYVRCWAWWNEDSCVLSTADGLEDDEEYDIWVEAISDWSYGPAADVVDNYSVDLGGDPAPIQVAEVATRRVPEPIVDLSSVSGARVQIRILGYVAVPQGQIRFDVVDPSQKITKLTGGLVAGAVRVDSGTLPNSFQVKFSNPAAQKRIRIVSTSSGDYSAVSDAVVQVNKSGSLAVNSWVVQ